MIHVLVAIAVVTSRDDSTTRQIRPNGHPRANDALRIGNPDVALRVNVCLTAVKFFPNRF